MTGPGPDNPATGVRDRTEASDDSSASVMVDGEGRVEGESVLCSVWRSRPPCFNSGGVASIRQTFPTLSLARVVI